MLRPPPPPLPPLPLPPVLSAGDEDVAEVRPVLVIPVVMGVLVGGFVAVTVTTTGVSPGEVGVRVTTDVTTAVVGGMDDSDMVAVETIAVLLVGSAEVDVGDAIDEDTADEMDSAMDDVSTEETEGTEETEETEVLLAAVVLGAADELDSAADDMVVLMDVELEAMVGRVGVV